MAKDKDRTLNPAAAHRKQEKQKALKKGKATLLASRTARLATRNPLRLERQIADLHSAPALNPHDKKQLQDLEAELARVKKAREARPDLVPLRSGGGQQDGGRGGDRGGGDRGGGGGGDRGGRGGNRGGGVLGKRSRDGGWARGGGGEGQGSGSETDASVRGIPMPRDTPPPLPRPRPRPRHHPNPNPQSGTNANSTPLGPGREGLARPREGTSLQEGAERPDLSLPAKPVQEGRSGGKTVYEAGPQVRDLRKEATRFLPGAVRTKIERGRGVGRLIGEEEVEGLERGGYLVGGVGGGVGGGLAGAGGMGGGGVGGGALGENVGRGGVRVDAAPEVRDGEGDERRRLEEEEERFAREMAEAEEEDDGGEGGWRGVTMEEVEDEDLEG